MHIDIAFQFHSSKFSEYRGRGTDKEWEGGEFFFLPPFKMLNVV
jgi:hypothetical protein